jgi:acyl-CoA thioesterase-1
MTWILRLLSCACVTAIGATGLYAAEPAPTPPAPATEKLFAEVIPLVGPAPKDAPKGMILKEGQSHVAIGDSITQFAGYLRFANAVLAQHYSDRKLPPIVNKGISGQKAEQLVQRFQRDVVNLKPATCSLSIGINDVWHRLGKLHDEQVLKAYRENVAKMVDMAQGAGIHLILLAPTVIKEDPQNEGNKRLPQYVEAMRQIAAEKKCAFVDLHAMFWEALKKKPAEATGNWLTSDGVHMAARGNAVMALGLLRALGVPDEKTAATDIPIPPPKAPKPRPAR